MQMLMVMLISIHGVSVAAAGKTGRVQYYGPYTEQRCAELMSAPHSPGFIMRLTCTPYDASKVDGQWHDQ